MGQNETQRKDLSDELLCSVDSTHIKIALQKVKSATERKLIRLTKPRLNESSIIQSKTKSKEHGDRRQGHRHGNLRS
ncbi:hypothetical protein Bca101_026189 [Brassica carinata]